MEVGIGVCPPQDAEEDSNSDQQIDEVSAAVVLEDRNSRSRRQTDGDHGQLRDETSFHFAGQPT